MKMCRTSVGTRLYISVLSVFVVFAVAFIIFQHAREREYKINTLNTRLQDYNERMMESLRYLGDRSDNRGPSPNPALASHRWCECGVSHYIALSIPERAFIIFTGGRIWLK